MTKTLKLDGFRDQLLALRAHLDAHVSQLPDEAYDAADPADRASQQVEAAVDLGLASHDANLRKEIEDALERIDAGTFAICANCQGAISVRRLEAIPYARYCVRCERRIEKELPAA